MDVAQPEEGGGRSLRRTEWDGASMGVQRWEAGESWPLSELGPEPVGTGDAARRGAHTQAVCTRISGLHAPLLWAPSKYLLQSLVAPPSLTCTPALRFLPPPVPSGSGALHQPGSLSDFFSM